MGGTPQKFDPLFLSVLDSGNRSARLPVKKYDTNTSGKAIEDRGAEPSECVAFFGKFDEKKIG